MWRSQEFSMGGKVGGGLLGAKPSVAGEAKPPTSGGKNVCGRSTHRWAIFATFQ